MAGVGGLVREWVSYPWRIDHASQRLARSTLIHSASFAGAGRHWQLSLVARTDDGQPIDPLPLYVTVVDPTALVVRTHRDGHGLGPSM